MTPAQLTQTSRRPNRSTARLASCSTAAWLRTSVGTASAPAPTASHSAATARDRVSGRGAGAGEDPCRANRGGGDGGPPPREPQGGRAPDPARGAGDHDDAAGEVARHVPAPPPFAASRN